MTLELERIREHIEAMAALEPRPSMIIVELKVPDDQLATAADTLIEGGWTVTGGYQGEYLSARPEEARYGVSINLRPASPNPGSRATPPHPAVAAWLAGPA
jgi:hypothetical protein